MVQADFQSNTPKLAVSLGKSYLRLKQKSNQQCNDLLDCDILNFHTSPLLPVDVQLPKIEKGRGLELCFLRVLTVQMSSASALAPLPLLANSQWHGHFGNLSATCQGLQTSGWDFGDFFQVFFSVFNRTIQKKISTAMLAVAQKQDMDLPPTAHLKYQNQFFQRRHPKSMASIYTILIPKAFHFKQDNISLGILQHLTAHMKELDGSTPFCS